MSVEGIIIDNSDPGDPDRRYLVQKNAKVSTTEPTEPTEHIPGPTHPEQDAQRREDVLHKIRNALSAADPLLW